MLPAYAPLLVTRWASQFYSLLRGRGGDGGRGGRGVCGRWEKKHSANKPISFPFQLPEGTTQLPIVRLVPDICAVKFLVLWSENCFYLFFSPHPERPRLHPLYLFSNSGPRIWFLFPAAPESCANEKLTDVFFRPPESCRPRQRRQRRQASDTLHSSPRLLTQASCCRCRCRLPPGRKLGYAAVIHLLQQQTCDVRTLTVAHTQ